MCGRSPPVTFDNHFVTNRLNASARPCQPQMPGRGRLGRITLSSFAVGLVIVGSLLVFAPVSDEVSAYEVRAPVYIVGDSEFTTANGVVSGSGTQWDPYVISGWDLEDFAAALEIKDTDAHFIVSDCYMHDSTYAILLSNARNGTVIGCNVSANYHGLYVDSCGNITISDNHLSMNMVRGLFLNNSTNITVTGNIIELNGEDGLFEWGGSGSFEIVGNSIVDNLDSGIEIMNPARIVQNTIANNQWFGIGLVESGSIIHHNNIIGNVIQAYQDDTTFSSWDNGYPEGGNYWGDYAGADQMRGPAQDQPGSDGIGDTPRNVPVGNQDRYPLMEPFEANRPPVPSFEVTPASGDTSTLFEFNASASWDYETPATGLLFRWDWDDDGTWDTGWSNESNATHTFASSGSHTVNLEIKDANDTTAECSLQVDVVEVIPELTALYVPLTAASLCLLLLALSSFANARRREGSD